MSAPATNALSPAPVRIDDPDTLRRCLRSSMARRSSSSVGAFERVEHLRPVDRDDGDGAVALEQQVVEGHDLYEIEP